MSNGHTGRRVRLLSTALAAALLAATGAAAQDAPAVNAEIRIAAQPLDSAIDSFLGALISDPPPTSGNLEELPSNTVGSANLTPTCSSSSSDDVHCSPGFDWLMRQEHQLGVGGSLLGGCSCASLPPSSSLTCCSSCSTAMACAPIMAHVGGSGDVEQQAGGVQASNGRRASSSQIRSVPNLNVEGQLYVGGETLKASGSSAWTVVSDARVKEVCPPLPPAPGTAPHAET